MSCWRVGEYAPVTRYLKARLEQGGAPLRFVGVLDHLYPAQDKSLFMKRVAGKHVKFVHLHKVSCVFTHLPRHETLTLIPNPHPEPSSRTLVPNPAHGRR